jgi:hypothetical protein
VGGGAAGSGAGVGEVERGLGCDRLLNIILLSFDTPSLLEG